MRRVGVTATALAALVLPPAAGAGTVGIARATPGVVDLMGLRGHAYALVQVRRGEQVPGGTLVSRRLGVWRLPTFRAERVGLGLHALAIEPDREVIPQRAAQDTFAGTDW
jgi:hypothetical protein